MQRQWDRVDFDPSPYQISLPYLTHFLCGYLSDASHMEQAFYLNSFEAVKNVTRKTSWVIVMYSFIGDLFLCNFEKIVVALY